MIEEQDASAYRDAQPGPSLLDLRSLGTAQTRRYLTSKYGNLEAAARRQLSLLLVTVLAFASALWVPLAQAAGLFAISKSASKYELRTVDARSGESRSITEFKFDSPFWYPASLAVSKDGSRVFAMSKTLHSPLLGGLFWGGTLHEFKATDGELVAARRLDRNIVGEVEAVQALSSGKLVGIAEEHALVEVDPSTGEMRVLNKVPFDSGRWSPGTFTVDPSETRAFAIMRGSRTILIGTIPYGNTLYEFDLADGKTVSKHLLNSPETQEIEALQALSPERLVGISSQHNLIEIAPSTGTVKVINKLNFDSGFWHPGSFMISRDGRSAFALSKTHYAADLGKTVFGNTLHEFDLSDGTLLSTQSLYRKKAEIEALARVPRASAYAARSPLRPPAGKPH